MSRFLIRILGMHGKRHLIAERNRVEALRLAGI
jgi:hypothetical protein